MAGGEYKAYVMHPQNRRRDLGLPLVVTNKLFADVALQPNRPLACYYELRTQKDSPYETPDSFLSALNKMANSVNGFEIDHFEERLEAFAKNNNLDFHFMSPVGYVRKFKERTPVDGYVGQLRIIKRKEKNNKPAPKLLGYDPDYLSEPGLIGFQAALSWFQVP